MIKKIASLLAKRRTLHAEMEIDHIELSPDSFILGLHLIWRNTTDQPIEILEVTVDLFHQVKPGTPLSLTYHGRFVRIPYQKTVTKIAGVTSLQVHPGTSRTENLRFLTREILDLKVGTYPVELRTIVAEGTYVHSFELEITETLKNRIAGSEGGTNALATGNSSVFMRALRLSA